MQIFIRLDCRLVPVFLLGEERLTKPAPAAEQVTLVHLPLID